MFGLERDRLFPGLSQTQFLDVAQAGVGGLAVGFVAEVPSRDGIGRGSAFDQQAGHFGIAIFNMLLVVWTYQAGSHEGRCEIQNGHGDSSYGNDEGKAKGVPTT